MSDGSGAICYHHWRHAIGSSGLVVYCCRCGERHERTPQPKTASGSDRDGYKRARGVVSGDEPAEVVIRRSRDEDSPVRAIDGPEAQK